MTRSERRFYVLLGALTLFLASVPYLWGWLITPPEQVYTGLAYNIDDGAVYLSWIRQAENGHFFLRNQFTTEPQRGVLFNLYFWLLGTIVRFTQIPAIAVYHGARVLSSALCLWAAAALLQATLKDARARRAAFALVCLSSGFGWLFGGYMAERGEAQPIDLWQPEAITFLSLYVNPLFPAALALMLVFMAAILRAERTGRLRDIWPAALAGALLGNFHSYDVIHLFAVWGAYRILTDILRRRLDIPGWARLVLAGLATLPTTAYQYWALRVEPVFFERALVSATWSPDVWWILLGYGLPATLTLWALMRIVPRPGRGTAEGETLLSYVTDAAALRFLLTWAVIGIVISYTPVNFQRKMLMGTHIPLCTIAGVMLANLTARLPGNLPRIALAGAVLLTLPTNLWFLARDMNRLVENVGSTPHRPRLTRDEWDALIWLKRHTAPGDTVLAGLDPTSHLRFPGFALYPHLSVYVPAFAGNVVYNGHWSETARFPDKMGMASRFFRADMPDEFRRELLREAGITYVLYVNALAGTELQSADGFTYRAVSWPLSPPPYLRRAYANKEITVYEVAL